MANVLMNGVYNHFLTSYASTDITKADSHKKNELKDIYKSIVKINKESPLYLLSKDTANEEAAIALKESARRLSGDLAAMRGDSDTTAFDKKQAYSSDEEAANVIFIGKEGTDPPAFDLEISGLAQSQKNTGTFIANGPTSLEAGSYFFDARIGTQNFEFQFSISSNDTNLEIQERIARLINKAGVSLSAEILTNDEGANAVEISSDITGIPKNQDRQFEIHDALNSPRHGIVPYFGLGNVSREPEDASFSIDGVEHTSSSNRFTVAQSYEIELKSTTFGTGPTHIGLRSDNESILSNVKGVVDSFNKFLDSVNELGAGSKDDPNKKIKTSSVQFITPSPHPELASLGITAGDDGHMVFDPEVFRNTVDFSKPLDEQMKPIREFTEGLNDMSKQIMLDPMKFTERSIVNYKNPGHEYANPYATSEYSGMMFNNYC